MSSFNEREAAILGVKALVLILTLYAGIRFMNASEQYINDLSNIVVNVKSALASYDIPIGKILWTFLTPF